MEEVNNPKLESDIGSPKLETEILRKKINPKLESEIGFPKSETLHKNMSFLVNNFFQLRNQNKLIMETETGTETGFQY